LDSLRQLDWASRDMRRRHKQVEAATRELAATLQRNPTEAEVAQKLGMDVERWRSMMLDLRNVGLISASTRGNENEDLPAPDFPTKPESHPDSICAREQLRSVTLDDPKLMQEILLALIEDAGRQAGSIEAAFAAGDSQRAIKLARYSARACDQVGASRTAGVLRSIERAAAASDLASGTAAIASLAAELDRLRAETAQL